MAAGIVGQSSLSKFGLATVKMDTYLDNRSHIWLMIPAIKDGKSYQNSFKCNNFL